MRSPCVLLRQAWAFVRRHLDLDLALENLALRQQLAVALRRPPHRRPRNRDRVFWVALSKIWPRWREALAIVKPATVVSWHRQGFRLFWRWKSTPGPGRPPIAHELQELIRTMANANPLWGAPRIHGELAMLGIDLAESTVAAYMPKRRRPPAPSASWPSMARLHLEATSGMDFFTIPTATFGVLYGFIVIDHASRALQRVNVTAHPTAEWTKQQLREAFADHAPVRLHRDNDRIYGDVVKKLIEDFGIEDHPSAPRSPWQNPYAERVIGSVRRELFDHVIVLNEVHARRLLREYQRYYNHSRTHLSLDKDSPMGRRRQKATGGDRIIAIPEVFGLHHRYERRAA
jgi:putative transposase